MGDSTSICTPLHDLFGSLDSIPVIGYFFALFHMYVIDKLCPGWARAQLAPRAWTR